VCLRFCLLSRVNVPVRLVSSLDSGTDTGDKVNPLRCNNDGCERTCECETNVENCNSDVLRGFVKCTVLVLVDVFMKDPETLRIWVRHAEMKAMMLFKLYDTKRLIGFIDWY
jgi:hypothetical protein